MIGVVFVGHDEPQATVVVAYPNHVPPFATTVLSGAVHERITTAHDPFEAGATDQEPFAQVEVTTTELQFRGEATDEVEYEVQTVPLAEATHPPLAAHPSVQVEFA